MVKLFCSHCGTIWEVNGVIESEEKCPNPKCGCEWAVHSMREEGTRRVQVWVNRIARSYEGEYFNDGYWRTIKDVKE